MHNISIANPSMGIKDGIEIPQKEKVSSLIVRSSKVVLLTESKSGLSEQQSDTHK